MKALVKTKAEVARENGKKGGRPPGVKTYATLQKEAVLKVLRLEIMGVAHVLFKEQLHLATGRSYLFKIEKKKITEGTGKNKTVKYVNKKPKRVTKELEILDYLKGIVENGDIHDYGDPTATYFYITAKDADNKAIDSLLDRAFGKSVQQIAIEPPTPADEKVKDKIKKARSEILD